MLLTGRTKILSLIAGGILLAAVGTIAVVAASQGGGDCHFTGEHAAEHCATWEAHHKSCEATPDEPHCHELLQQAEHARYCNEHADDPHCAQPAPHDPHAQFCHDHPDSPHCRPAP